MSPLKFELSVVRGDFEGAKSYICTLVRLTVLLSALLQMLCVNEVYANEINLKRLKVTVAGIPPLPPSSNQNVSAIYLRFENLSHTELRIPFTAWMGKGSGYYKPIYRRDDRNWYGGMTYFSELRYSWRRKSGELVCDGRELITKDSLYLKPNRMKEIVLPIQLPPPGSYILNVVFDNEKLEQTEGTTNMFQHPPASNVFGSFQAEEIEVSIKDVKSYFPN